jgi:type 1 glutamine amidotransferase
MKKALIIYGGYEGHDPEKVARILSGILEKADFNVVVSDSLESLEDQELMGQVDLIVPHWTMGTITKQQLEMLLKAVENGAGIAGMHGGLGDGFRNETKYQYMVGGQFVAHPGDDGVTYDVEIETIKHDVIEGLGKFTVKTELYYMHFDPAIEVLAYTKTNGIKMPVVWTKSYGKGRVFYCSLGHSVDIVEKNEVKTLMERGMTWAAKS